MLIILKVYMCCVVFGVYIHVCTYMICVYLAAILLKDGFLEWEKLRWIPFFQWCAFLIQGN